MRVGEQPYDLYLEQDYEGAWWGWILKDGKMFPPGTTKLRFEMHFETDEQAETRAKQEMHRQLFTHFNMCHSCDATCQSWSRREV